MEKIKAFLPPIDKCPNINFSTRIFSFLVCLVIGFIFTALSIAQLTYPIAHYRNFSLWYSLSNMIWLISTFIIIGPKENYTKLLSDDLYSKSIFLTGSIILGFIFGILTTSKIINLIFDFLQFFSLHFFSFFYISNINTNKNDSNNIEELQYENNNSSINEINKI